MSALREAAQQALEALEYAQQDRECPSTTRQAITALRAVLAQEQVDPTDPGFWGRAAARQASRIKQLEAVTQQALEALKSCSGVPHWPALQPTIDALRAALAQEQAEPKPMHPELRKMWEEHFDRCFRAMPLPAQEQEQAEPLNLLDRAVQRRLAAQWGYVPAEQAEPAQEPVAVVRWNDIGHISWRALVMLPDGTPLYTAPPRRTMVPLTDEEILAAVGWERAEMYMKLTPNFPVDEAKKETLKNARAIEKASWEKNHGQA